MILIWINRNSIETYRTLNCNIYSYSQSIVFFYFTECLSLYCFINVSKLLFIRTYKAHGWVTRYKNRKKFILLPQGSSFYNRGTWGNEINLSPNSVQILVQVGSVGTFTNMWRLQGPKSDHRRWSYDVMPILKVAGHGVANLLPVSGLKTPHSWNRFRRNSSIHGRDITTSSFWKQTVAILKFYFRSRFWPSHRHIVCLHRIVKFHLNRTICGRVSTL